MKKKNKPVDKTVDAGIHAVGGTAIGIGMLPVAAVGSVVGLAIYGVKKAIEK